MKTIKAKTQKELEQFCGLQGTSSLSAEALARRDADAHWMALENGKVLARCSLWWTNVPAFSRPNRRLGLIGHYAAQNAEAGRSLLQHACAQLQVQGCALAVGPMDGNTWRSYRLITDQGAEPPFFLEMRHPPDWPEHFSDLGFTVLANYFSALNQNLQQDPRLSELRRRVGGQGIQVRPFDPAHFDQEISRIYELSITGFGDNFLYSPIGWNEFYGMYSPIKPHLRPELVLIAEREQKPVGFLFALPDLLQAQRGRAVDTVIFKTVAVLPELGGSGLGSLLVAEGHRVAAELGFKRAIHALMYEDNVSRKISAHYAKPMRRYSLFAKELSHG
ncbi:MAG TPA: GNAT family N-acetyltransferase [Candidatus Bipolaricaulota bacterium]